jgi:hypothetical protein
MTAAHPELLSELLDLDFADFNDPYSLSPIDSFASLEGVLFESKLSTAISKGTEEGPTAPRTPSKADVWASSGSQMLSPSGSPPSERSDSTHEAMGVQACENLGCFGQRVAEQLLAHKACSGPGTNSPSMQMGWSLAGADEHCLSLSGTQEYMLVRLDGEGRVLRSATEEDMALLSELLRKQSTQDSSSDGRHTAPDVSPTVISRKPGGPCCHCNVTGKMSCQS